MINLKQPNQPYKIGIAPGFTVTVKPLKTLS